MGLGASEEPTRGGGAAAGQRFGRGVEDGGDELHRVIPLEGLQIAQEVFRPQDRQRKDRAHRDADGAGARRGRKERGPQDRGPCSRRRRRCG